MNSVATSLVFIPGLVALVLFLVFTYLYEQSRQAYFRAWQIGWGAYCLHYAIDAWTYYRGPSGVAFLLGSLLMVVMAVSILISTRLMKERFRLRWYDIAVAGAGTLSAFWGLWRHTVHGAFRSDVPVAPHLSLEVSLAVILLYSSFQFYRYAHQKGSLAFNLLAFSVALWAVLMGFSPELLDKLQSQGAGEYLSELAYRRGGFITFRNLGELEEPLPAFPGARFEQFKKVLSEENIRNLTAVSLQTREHNFGVIL